MSEMSQPVDTTTAPSGQAAEEKKTTVGNYFVSNYPPFSFWKKEGVDDFERAIARPPEPGTPLGLYLHIPFCRKRCHFCYFRVYTDKNATAINGYLKAAAKELECYRRQPFIGDRSLDFVYFGGGTPSYLSVDQLTQLTQELKGGASMGSGSRSYL